MKCISQTNSSLWDLAASIECFRQQKGCELIFNVSIVLDQIMTSRRAVLLAFAWLCGLLLSTAALNRSADKIKRPRILAGAYIVEYKTGFFRSHAQDSVGRLNDQRRDILIIFS
jgi:hypothetical protein